MSPSLTALKDTNVLHCLECGKCTAVCPISRYNKTYSPRRMIGRMLTSGTDVIQNDEALWTCLTCQLCSQRCPQDVDFSHLMLKLRIDAFKAGRRPECSHGGALQSTMRMMTAPDLKQDRLGWIPKNAKVKKSGEDVYFVGCLPYFDGFFTDLKMNTLVTAVSAVTLMNKLGIEPAVLEDERCCGHDLLWMGDEDNFKKLAEHNLKILKEAGAKRVFFTCPEGFRTFSRDLPEYFGKLDFEVIYFPAFVAENADTLPLKSNGKPRIVTFHDACRLGRHMGDYDTPRKLLSKLDGVEIQEMRRNRAGGTCCGTSAWSNCDVHSKMIQTERLQEASDTGAEVMLTGCAKCTIHFNCTQQGPEESDDIKIPVQDFLTFFANEVK